MERVTDYEECTQLSHERAKSDPGRYLIDPQLWDAGEMVLWRCPLCNSPLGVPYFHARGAV